MPVSEITEYSEGQVIYGAENPSKNIYLVLAGVVEISRLAEGARGALLEIVQPDELFGESAFLKCRHPLERAIAIESTTVMCWSNSEMENLIRSRPELAASVLRFFARRNAEVKLRIESLSRETVELRLARSLIRLSERLGTLEGDGRVRLLRLSHEMLSRYVGTSREMVTHYMKRFEALGFVSDSGRGIVLKHDPFLELLSETTKKARRTRETRR